VFWRVATVRVRTMGGAGFVAYTTALYLGATYSGGLFHGHAGVIHHLPVVVECGWVALGWLQLESDLGLVSV